MLNPKITLSFCMGAISKVVDGAEPKQSCSISGFRRDRPEFRDAKQVEYAEQGNREEKAAQMGVTRSTHGDSLEFSG